MTPSGEDAHYQYHYRVGLLDEGGWRLYHAQLVSVLSPNRAGGLGIADYWRTYSVTSIPCRTSPGRGLVVRMPIIAGKSRQQRGYSYKGPIGDMSGLPENQVGRAISPDHSHKSMIADPKLENAKRRGCSSFPG